MAPIFMRIRRSPDSKLPVEASHPATPRIPFSCAPRGAHEQGTQRQQVDKFARDRVLYPHQARDLVSLLPPLVFCVLANSWLI